MIISRALALDPNYIFSLYDKGYALFYSGKYNQSVPVFDKALAMNHTSVYALFGKGADLAMLGKYNESMLYLDKVLTINPKHVNALNYKKLVLQKLNNTSFLSLAIP